MKRLLKFVITILAIAVLIGSAAWYILIYNPMFLHDALIRQARSSAASGNYSMAFWCCEQAEKLNDQPDPELAMEIANWHLNNGNYTKAEYTLTMAIRQQPTKELYLRLSRVYVEQDKLLDANNLIASIEDASIRAELEAMRPAVPTADPAPGFYDSYITVNVSGTDGTLYVTDDGSYPSTWKEAYAEPYTLPGGETTLLAMTVGENGLVSPLAELGYTAVPVQAQADALMEVMSGTSDAAVIDLLMAAAMTGEGTSYADLTYVFPLNAEEYGVAFRKGSDMVAVFNDFLAAAYADGTMDQLADAYGLTGSVIPQ